MGIINVLDSSHFLKANNHKTKSSCDSGEIFARLSRRAGLNPGLFISNTGLLPAVNHWK